KAQQAGFQHCEVCTELGNEILLALGGGVIGQERTSGGLGEITGVLLWVLLGKIERQCPGVGVSSVRIHLKQPIRLNQLGQDLSRLARRGVAPERSESAA